MAVVIADLRQHLEGQLTAKKNALNETEETLRFERFFLFAKDLQYIHLGNMLVTGLLRAKQDKAGEEEGDLLQVGC